jgi:hypothetical protein
MCAQDSVFQQKLPRIFPQFAVISWVCDGGASGGFQISGCCSDNGAGASPAGCASGDDGHRSVIMSANGATGCGWQWNSSRNTTIVACNPTGANTYPAAYRLGYAVDYGSVIFSAGHAFASSNIAQYFFVANIWTNTSTLQSASVILGTHTLPLSLLSGDANRGNYVSSTFLDPQPGLTPTAGDAASCVPYYFSVVTQPAGGGASTTYRYPAQGYYYTYYVSGCGLNYAATDTAGGGTLSPTIASTAQPVTTTEKPQTSANPNASVLSSQPHALAFVVGALALLVTARLL